MRRTWHSYRACPKCKVKRSRACRDEYGEIAGEPCEGRRPTKPLEPNATARAHHDLIKKMQGEAREEIAKAHKTIRDLEAENKSLRIALRKIHTVMDGVVFSRPNA